MVKHGEVVKRTINVVNLDPAAEHFDYPIFAGNIFVLKNLKKKKILYRYSRIN